MLSKNKIKFIHSLEQKKARRETACFVAEGNKLVNDTIRSFDCRLLVATASWLEEHPGLRAEEIIEVSSEEIKKVSLQKTPQDVIAVYRIPGEKIPCLVTQEEGAVRLIYDLQELNGQRGFVIAPFRPNETCPILLIQSNGPGATFASCR